MNDTPAPTAGPLQGLRVIEQALSRIACGLVEAGVGRFVIAGGEISGACVQALSITQLRIGPQIDPAAPWCHAATPLRRDGLHLANPLRNLNPPSPSRRGSPCPTSPSRRQGRP